MLRRSPTALALSAGLLACVSCGAPQTHSESRAARTAPPGTSAPMPTASEPAHAAPTATTSAAPQSAAVPGPTSKAAKHLVVRTAPLGAAHAKTTYKVKYAPEAVVLDQNVARALSAKKPGELDFDAQKLGARASRIKPGKVLLVYGKALARVESVQRRSGRLVVHTSPATLADAIEQGTVAWDVSLPLDRAHVTAALAPADQSRALARLDRNGRFASTRLRSEGNAFSSPGVLSQGPIDWAFQRGPMTYKFRLEPKGKAVDIKIEAIKKQGPKATLAYTAHGTFENVRGRARADYADHKLTDLDYEQPELVGDITLSVAAAGSGLGKIDFPFPGAMFGYLVMVGPVPVKISVGAKLIGSITVPARASARATARFRFRSSSGFSYAGNNVKVKGNIGNLTLSPKPFDSAAMIGIPVDAQWGVAFPRVSVGVFDNVFVPFLHTGVVVGTSLKWGPVCKYGYVKYVAEVGYDLGVFGVKLKSAKKTIAEREKKAPPGGCPARK